MRYELLHVLQSEDFASGRKKQLLHVFSAHTESSPSYASDHFELRLTCRLPLGTEGTEMLNARDLVTRRAVVLGKFGFDNDLRVELIGDDKVGSLVKTG